MVTGVFSSLINDDLLGRNKVLADNRRGIGVVYGVIRGITDFDSVVGPIT